MSRADRPSVSNKGDRDAMAIITCDVVHQTKEVKKHANQAKKPSTERVSSKKGEEEGTSENPKVST